MKKNVTPLVDEHLEILLGLQEPATDDFFYTRLKARMERQASPQEWSFPLKPVWIVSILFVFLAINSVMLVQRSGSKEVRSTASVSSLQNFAESYDQVISSSY